MSSSSKSLPLRSALKTDDDGENKTPPLSGSSKGITNMNDGMYESVYP